MSAISVLSDAVETTRVGEPRPFPDFSLRPTPLWKRAIDVLGGGCLLILALPLLVVLGVYVKLVSPGPVLFVQERIGAGTQRFKMYKLRTMHVASEPDSHRDYVAGLVGTDRPAVKPAYHSRLICGGRLLRSLSLDELPQLFNVLLGNMSLIGPRPEVLQLQDYEPWQLRRFEVLPGISGLWQVSGKNRLTFKQMIKLDIEYVDRLSFQLDMWILRKTFWVIVLRRNH